MCYFAKYLQFKVSRIDIFFLQRPDIANPTASFSFLLLSIFFPAYSYQGITEKKKQKQPNIWKAPEPGVYLMMSFIFILLLNIMEPTLSGRPRVKKTTHLLFAYQTTMVICTCFQEKKVNKSVCNSEYQKICIHSGMSSRWIFSAQISKRRKMT